MTLTISAAWLRIAAGVTLCLPMIERCPITQFCLFCLFFSERLTELREIFEEETQANMELDNLEMEMNSEETALKKQEFKEI